MHATPYSDVSIVVSQFLLKLTGVWMTVNDGEKRRRRIAMAYTFVIQVYGLYLNIGDIYHSWDDLSHCIFLTCNTLCIVLTMFKFSILFIRRTEFKNLILFARKNFWHLDYDRHETILFTKCRKFCTLWTLTVFSFTQASLTFYIITPICANIGKNKSERILPFKMWVDFPLSETPYYEIMFVIQLLTVQQIGIAYTCNDNFLCVLNMHVVCQFRILQHRLTKLWSIIDERADKFNYASKCYEALKECIRQHQSLIEFCDKLEHVYTLPIFGHVVVFSLLMCFDTYEIFLFHPYNFLHVYLRRIDRREFEYRAGNVFGMVDGAANGRGRTNAAGGREGDDNEVHAALPSIRRWFLSRILGDIHRAYELYIVVFHPHEGIIQG
ncbi:odorant receptor Or2 isoform X2 [Apis mellifera]|uniref:Odorant receptor n=1 Tax=Apis mellifera TaxID=7460 RepID=A0A7M7IPW0_APIME|nr:odorant receptor Or2 isoform X2 [Apis mellifera]|eukprot:XP_016771083.1 odorant receptor Or2 isoform X2 [Apis mellifera]